MPVAGDDVTIYETSSDDGGRDRMTVTHPVSGWDTKNLLNLGETGSSVIVIGKLWSGAGLLVFWGHKEWAATLAR